MFGLEVLAGFEEYGERRLMYVFQKLRQRILFQHVSVHVESEDQLFEHVPTDPPLDFPSQRRRAEKGNLKERYTQDTFRNPGDLGLATERIEVDATLPLGQHLKTTDIVAVRVVDQGHAERFQLNPQTLKHIFSNVGKTVPQTHPGKELLDLLRKRPCCNRHNPGPLIVMGAIMKEYGHLAKQVYGE